MTSKTQYQQNKVHLINDFWKSSIKVFGSNKKTRKTISIDSFLFVTRIIVIVIAQKLHVLGATLPVCNGLSVIPCAILKIAPILESKNFFQIFLGGRLRGLVVPE